MHAVRTLALLAAIAPAAQAADLRGIYVYSSDVSQISTSYANEVRSSLSVSGVDGMVLVISWSALEPSMGHYDWSALDSWMVQAAATGKKVDLTITAGSATPAWLFATAGAKALNFTVSPHSGATGNCISETIAPPWDAVFLAQWDSLLAAVAAHLHSSGTYGAVTLLRLTGINRTTDEMRLPAETPQSTSLPCVSDSITTWKQAGFRPSLLLQGWDAITSSFQKSFSDKSFGVAIIPANPFPPIGEDGSTFNASTVDENAPLLSLAAAKFPGRLVVQNNFLMPGEAAAPEVVQAAQTLGTMAAFQTNNYFGSTGQGAGCSEPVTNPTPCTATTYLQLLETGIYPLGSDNSLRAQYIEVFPANANAFPAEILQGHEELVPEPRRRAVRH